MSRKNNFIFFSLFFLLTPIYATEAVSPVNSSSNAPCAGLKKLAGTDDLKKSYKVIESTRYWNHWIDDETDYRRFISKKSYETLKNTTHPVDMYGEQNYLAWKRASDYLNEIPKGKLELSIELFSKVHEIATQNLSPSSKYFSYFLPSSLIFSSAGVIKKRLNYGADPLVNPLTEAQYETIKQNPWLSGFTEIPFLSKPDKRRGVLLYANPSETHTKLEKLITWYRENKDSMDPVELAARFQQAYASIHPFIDGNGRTSRLLMDRILAEHGLPAALIESHENDIYTSPEEYVKQVREGIELYLDLHRKNGSGQAPPMISHPGSYYNGLGIRTAGDTRTYSKHHPQMSVTSLGTPEILLGGKPFTLFKDGFFYSNRGIPYVLHEGAMYPITDLSYALYFTRLHDRINKVKLTEGQKDVYRTHFGLLRKIRQNQVEADSIKIMPYKKIEQANKTNTLFLYEWQKEVFKKAVEINTSDAGLTLSRSRLIQTDFEMQNQNNTSQVLAQYEAVDLKFWKYEEYAKKYLPDSVNEIRKSREKLWSAGRELIKDYLTDRQALSDQDLKELKNFSAFHAWETYVSHSKLSFENFNKALKETNDNKIYLLRADANEARFLGIRSEEDYKRFFNSLPGSQRIKRFLKELETYLSAPENLAKIQEKIQTLQAKVDANEKLLSFFPKTIKEMAKNISKLYGNFLKFLQTLNKRVFGNKYEARGTSAEYERAFVDFVLHAKGYTPHKVGTSFSTSYELLAASNSESLPFSGEALTGSSLYLVDLPKASVEWNFASTFSREYEVLGMKPVYPWQIKNRYTGQMLASGRPDNLTPNAEQFLTRYKIGNVQKDSIVKKTAESQEKFKKHTKVYQAVMASTDSTQEQKSQAQQTYNEKWSEYQKELKAISNPTSP